jgi:putative OPT family oligopeptide transporter
MSAQDPVQDPESRWLSETYQPAVRQFTLRAVLVGMLIGGVMCLSNLYVFFKTGWSMGVTITAAILAFTLFQGLRALRLERQSFSALENNVLTTVASGAGYMTGGGNMAAFGALLMVTQLRPDIAMMVLWFAAIAALGVFAAIPIKRQLINQEGLAFPTGTATAETIRTLHSQGGSGSRQSLALGLAALFAALLTWLRAAAPSWKPFAVPEKFTLPFQLAGKPLAEWTLSIKAEVVLLGAGGLMSWRTAWSVLLGGILTYAVMAPALLEQGAITAASYKAIVAWTVWPGAALLVASGLTSFVLDWKSIVRAVRGMTSIFGRKEAQSAIDAVECPAWWFPAGFLVLTPIVVWLMMMLFEIPMWAAFLAIPLSVLMGFVAARVTGETDVTPTKALGPVTQLIYGAATPGNMAGNIMSANVTGGVGLHAADLLTTLKTGWLLGGNPRAQFYGQLFGVIAGAAILVPAFNLLIPDPAVLGSEEWPAPSCIVWAGVSEAFSDGLGALSGSAKRAIVIGLLLGVALALLERFAPPKAKAFVPSPAGLGIAMVIPGSNAIAMFTGGAIAEILRRKWRAIADAFVVPVSSGLIAGESLMGVAVVVVDQIILK